MSEKESTTTNTAESGSSVGIQAEQVHNSTVYQVLPEDPPERRYQVGVRYLENGVPVRARELIIEAIAKEHDSAEVRFHWVLAMLSKRSYRDLAPDERSELQRLPEHLGKYADDEWKHALEAVSELLDHLGRPDGDPSNALDKLKALRSRQRDQILRHCSLVLSGGMKDVLWAETSRLARQQQHDGDRINRVWAYFQPNPIPARVRQPDRDATTPSDYLLAVISGALSMLSVGYLGWILLQGPTPLAVIVYLVALVAGSVAAKAGSEWRYRAQRGNARDDERIARVHDRKALERGFAKRVDEQFQHYSNKYAPNEVDRGVWLAESRDARAALRDELVEIYRESRIDVGRVTWLIRFMVREVRRDWREGSLLEYRTVYQTRPATKVSCLLAVATAALAAAAVGAAAIRLDPLPAWAAVILAVVSGRVAMIRWMHIMSERWRLAEETRECARVLKARDAEHRRWKEKLEATCPDESEMETWLEADKAILVDEAMQHYGLAWRDVIARAIVQTPAKSCKRARVKHGHWRYSKYDLHLFLITSDGVRELARQLDFEHVSFHGHQRGNFRFDAVSSLHVIKSGAYDYTLELTLTNGPSRIIEVTEPKRDLEQPAEEEPGLAKISLDSTGFAHALHVLEGIAAEGKAWIDRDARAKDATYIARGVDSLL